MIEGERARILPTLQKPYQGEFDELKAEIDKNERKFFSRAGKIFIEENFDLAGLSRFSQRAPDLELSLKLFSLYYEIYSRASRKENTPMIVVDQEVIDSFREKDIERLKSFEDNEGEKGGNVAYTELISFEAHKRIMEERAKSTEMDEFWHFVDATEEDLREEGRDSIDIFNNFYPLYALQEMLLLQDKINKEIAGFDIPDEFSLE